MSGPGADGDRCAPAGGRFTVAAVYAAAVAAFGYALVSLYWAVGGRGLISAVGGFAQRLAGRGGVVAVLVAVAVAAAKAAGGAISRPRWGLAWPVPTARCFRLAWGGVMMGGELPAPAPGAARGAMRQWRRAVSIGEDLAQARCRAGLSVTEVSRRTRIRETIINGIEHDDYSACGGDFYARGHIRAIAKAVGADPGPLIAEYDAAHRAPQPVPAADLLGPARGPVSNRSRHRRAWAIVVIGLALAAALAVAGYHVLAGSHHAPGAPRAAAAGPPRPGHHRARHAAPPLAASRYAHEVVIRLAAAEDCWVEFTTPGGRYLSQSIVAGGTSKRWVFRHAIDVRLGNPGGIRLRVDGTNPLPPGTVEPITLRLHRADKASG